jgi:hypothetical protein
VTDGINNGIKTIKQRTKIETLVMDNAKFETFIDDSVCHKVQEISM